MFVKAQRFIALTICADTSSMRISIVAGILACATIFGSCAGHPKGLSVHLADYSDQSMSNRLRVEMPGGEAPLYAETRSVLEDHDFRSVSLGEDELGLPVVRLCFSPNGRERYDSMAQRNLHRRLVFLVDGKLLFAPQIESASTRECVGIDGAVTPEQAATLKRAIR
jgi:preprotein translocase subunit SecD